MDILSSASHMQTSSNATSGQLPEATSTGRALYVHVDNIRFARHPSNEPVSAKLDLGAEWADTLD